MKNGQIFARKSTARGGLDLEYLDETSRRKISLRERENMDQQIGKKLKHFADYASKETLGQARRRVFPQSHLHQCRRNENGSVQAFQCGAKAADHRLLAEASRAISYDCGNVR